MPLTLLILLVVAVSGLLGLSGGLLMLITHRRTGHLTMYLVSFAAGALLGVVFFDMLPEVLGTQGGIRWLPMILLGILLFFLIEKGIISYHCHHEKCVPEPTRYTLVIGDILHNALDGVAIAAAFLVSQTLGWATALAVLIHELPQEIADFGALLALKMKPARIVWVNIVSALASVVGALFVLGFTSIAGMSTALVAITAGGFLYIANTDLIPATHKDARWTQTLAHVGMLLLGVIAMAAVGVYFKE